MGQGTNIGGATINDIVPSGGSRNKLGLDELFPPLPSTTLWPINRPVSSSVPSPSTLSTMDSVTTARTVYSVAVNNPDLASEPNYTLSGIFSSFTHLIVISVRDKEKRGPRSLLH